MSKGNINAVMAVVFVVIVALGCRALQQGSSSSGPSSQPPSPQSTVNQQQPDQAQRDNEPTRPIDNPFPAGQPAPPPAQNPNAGGDNGDPSVLYGSWASDQTLNGMQCHAEYIFENTGTYSSLAYCASYMTRSVGTWRLIQPGVVRIEYTDHEPKEFGGQPIRYPSGETFTFTVVNRDRLDTSGGTIVREF